MPVACPAGTRGLEARLRRDGGHFALLTSYTHDSEPMQTTVILRALDKRAPLPFRVLLEEVDTETWTHTLSEGAFATFGATRLVRVAIRRYAITASPRPRTTPAAPPPSLSSGRSR
ncbi:hypothetical protein [Streptomyces sp. NPDC093707]|uniref:hypothetical protein n=1 Tax=Streptomyces sp. NPDC093707 TaxID=3154984 RepID=UPI00344CB9C5